MLSRPFASFSNKNKKKQPPAKSGRARIIWSWSGIGNNDAGNNEPQLPFRGPSPLQKPIIMANLIQLLVNAIKLKRMINRVFCLPLLQFGMISGSFESSIFDVRSPEGKGNKICKSCTNAKQDNVPPPWMWWARIPRKTASDCCALWKGGNRTRKNRIESFVRAIVKQQYFTLPDCLPENQDPAKLQCTLSLSRGWNKTKRGGANEQNNGFNACCTMVKGSEQQQKRGSLSPSWNPTRYYK